MYFGFYFDRDVSEVDRDLAKSIVIKVMVHFYVEYSSHVDIERVDFPMVIPCMWTQVYKKDESSQEEESRCFSEYAEKEWVNITTLQPVVYSKQCITSNNLLSLIRKSLEGKIQQNLRSIQVVINQLKRTVVLWFHFEGKIVNSILDASKHVKSRVVAARYNAEVYTERLDAPSPIPCLGYFIFKRDDESPDVKDESEQNAKISILEELQDFISNQVASLWTDQANQKESHLRAIKIAVDSFEKSLFLLFVFDGPFYADDSIKAKKLIQQVELSFFSGYSHEGYMARYDHPEQIPTIGHVAYLYSSEIIKQVDARERFFQSVSEALVGRISEHLRAVKVELDEYKKIAYFWFYFTGEVTADDKSFARSITDLSCPATFKCNSSLQQLDSPMPIPTIGCVIYRSYEP